VEGSEGGVLEDRIVERVDFVRERYFSSWGIVRRSILDRRRDLSDAIDSFKSSE